MRLDFDFNTIFWIVVIALPLLSSVLKRVFDKSKGPVPGPKPGEGAGDRPKDLRDFLRQLEGLAKGEEEKPRTEAPPARRTLPIPVPPRQSAPAHARRSSATRPRTAEVALSTSTPSTARAGGNLGTAVARAVTRVAAAKARFAEESLEAERARAASGRIRSRLSVVPGVSTRDLAESVVWAEILGKPRAARPWRTPATWARSA